MARSTLKSGSADLKNCIAHSRCIHTFQNFLLKTIAESSRIGNLFIQRLGKIVKMNPVADMLNQFVVFSLAGGCGHRSPPHKESFFLGLP